jgi:hypothetical protein
MNQESLKTGALHPEFIKTQRVFIEFMANDPDTASNAALHIVRALSFMFNEKINGFELSTNDVSAVTHMLYGTELLIEMTRTAFDEPPAA